MINWSGHNAAANKITINSPTQAGLLDDLRACAREGTGYSVATLNLDHVVKLRRDPQFQEAYQAHTHVTADGNPIVWLSRLAGKRVSLVTGSDLIAPILSLAEAEGVPVAFFGATQEALDAAAQAIHARHPDLEIVARVSPPMGFDPTGPEADAAIEQLSRSGARLVFLALGAPKQEIFAARAQTQLTQTGFLSIGAGLDFIAGRQKRAPAFVRRFAGEWIWRLVNNPRRLGARYGACLAILPKLFADALRARFTQKAVT